MEPDKHVGSLVETIFSALFSTIFLLLYIKPDLLAIYQRGVAPIPMLSSSSARSLIFGLFFFSLITLAVCIVKLKKKQWSTHLIWASVVSELADALYFAYFMTRWDALDKEFVRYFRGDLATWALIAKAAVLCFLALTVISIADDLYKTYKHKKIA
ncbi:MAG TPA: hypothetical protein GXZ69_02650 [Spirochaetales bacterium]|jgi:hypothetical protein|nr:hypothetical protein [Spirochaetales bacterium]